MVTNSKLKYNFETLFDTTEFCSNEILCLLIALCIDT